MTHRHESTGPLRRLAGDVARGARAETVFGPPVEHAGVVVIPVARARFGFGGGGGRDRRGEAGEGGGGGAVVRPAGYIELRKGRARFRRVTTVSDIGGIVLVIALAAVAWRFARPCGRPGTAQGPIDADVDGRQPLAQDPPRP